MPATFDRSSDDDAKASADKILEKVADGLMPCDGPRAGRRRRSRGATALRATVSVD